MRNYRVSVRASVSFLFVIGLLIALGGISLVKMKDLRAGMVALQTDAMASVILANEISISTLRVRLEARRLIAQDDPQAKVLTIERLKTARNNMLKHTADYAPLATGKAEEDIYQGGE